MGVTWVNIYNNLHPHGFGPTWETAIGAQFGCSCGNDRVDERFTRVELRINGHWHRPPVGMRSQQASHVWRLFRADPDCDVSANLQQRLESRS